MHWLIEFSNECLQWARFLFTELKVEQSNQTKFGRKKLCEGILFWSEHKHEILIIYERTEIRFTWMKYKVLRCCSWLSMSLSEAFSDKVRTWTLSQCDIFSTNHEHTMWLVYLIWWLKKHTIFRCKTYIKNKNQWVCTTLYSYDVILNSKLSFYPHVCVCVVVSTDLHFSLLFVAYNGFYAQIASVNLSLCNRVR